MIARLSGILDSCGDDWLVIDVHGVGYLVQCSSRTLSRLSVGQPLSLHIETVVREDALTLYGFTSPGERAFFRLLTTVQGVGAKVALSILTIAEPARLAEGLAIQDKALFARATGVGPKLAARIVSELKDKAASLPLSSASGTAAPPPATAEAGTAPPPSPEAAAESEVVAAPRPVDDSQFREDALSALVNLGYGRSEAFAALVRAGQTIEASGKASSTPALISGALKELGKNL